MLFKKSCIPSGPSVIVGVIVVLIVCIYITDRYYSSSFIELVYSSGFYSYKKYESLRGKEKFTLGSSTR